MENNKLQERDSFGSKLGIIAAAAGSAIGLGNIWKFPYITGVYGGAAFIVIYLICIAAIGFPVMLSEFIIGRKGQRNAIGAFQKLAPGTPWFLTGWMGVAAAFMILAFYGVVAGWCLEYVFKALINSFAGQSPEAIGNMFGSFISSTAKPIFWQVFFMLLTGLIVIAGVKDGIEKYAKILMPALLVIIIILDIRAVTLPGAKAGLEFLFKPDWGKVSAQGVLVALGHAFFSLSLGMGTMITYGSYIGKKENLADTAIQVTIADTLIALLAGIAIFPAVFAFGIEPGAGAGLVFVTLPNVFQQMPGGYFFAILFFILLTVAALTSSISILEVVVAYFVEDLKMARKRATVIATIAITLLGIPCSLSMGSMSKVTFFGKNFFDLLDFTASNIFLPLGGLLISAFVGWYMGKKEVEAEVNQEGVNISYIPLFMFLVKFIAPIAIAIVFLNGIGLLKF
ncbi:neurotransmitter:Na+ symporter, NSS family [Caminicella sporogenes DSM 14501]|uniref:Transporter n=1 Tax=Caminicella sporogenes DSM 14501 TaxID=1121266 RepID=A0A1M6S5C7_9FIRM|nr:sodium-dependent transporter [Caminicella sporogenes]RKD27201.1 Na+-dependent transporter [Caminicella sporogenes]WIF95497.1 sodium-dependent transporter [Caminicella sporogenes]SHK39916.1 neurotransmitter:Na+ symporter, NSS family [Caminicella sporogenes DSM 14501]